MSASPSGGAGRWRRQQWMAQLVQTIFLLNLLIIFCLWVNGGNLTRVHSGAAALTSAGRITGLLAAYFLLVQVLLLARLPFLKAIAGFDRLTIWHRRNGRITLLLIVTHVACIVAGYAHLDRMRASAEVRTLLTHYPGMIQALAGTALLILVGVTSATTVRRRLRYERWYALHLTAYAGIFLTWFHQIPNGNEFVLSPVPSAYWTALSIATVQLVILCRLVQPLVRCWWHGLRVSEVVQEAPGVVSVRMTGRHIDWMDVHAGQFFLWRFLAPTVWREAHPFSLSAAPQRDSLRITVKALGDFSTDLADIRPGTRVLAEGPFGSFTSQARRHERAVLIAAGIGITPIRSLLEEMDGELTLIYRARGERDLIFRSELDGLQRPGVCVHYVMGERSQPGSGYLLSGAHLRELVPNIASCDVYLCGPTPMMHAVQRTLRRIGVAKASIHADEFAF